MSQINQEKIERLNSDADEIIRLSEEFFSSIPIQRKKQIISSGSPIPSFDGGYQNTGSNYSMSYSWSKLSTELSELQVELLRKYDLWYENSSFLIRKFLSDRLDAFDESYKNGREYITLNCSPIDKQSIKSFYKFKQHFNIQRNILSLIFSVVEDEKTNKKIIQEVPINLGQKQKAEGKEKIQWYKRPEIIIPAIVIILAAIISPLFTFCLNNLNDYLEINQESDTNIIGDSIIKPSIENLTIHTSRLHNDYDTEIIPFNVTDFPAILPVYFDCILTNNGENTLSILKYDLEQINNKDYPMSYYSYMNGGLFDSTGNQVQFPLNIDSKKSYKFYLKVGIAIHPDAYVLISNNFTPFTTISIMEITSHLAINGMDSYGNSIEPLTDQGNYYGFQVPNLENVHEQIFLITFTTGSGNDFIDTFSWYKLNDI